jgi:TetR/AcrR family transcriptional regulator, transcriptional repressor for nem operon
MAETTTRAQIVDAADDLFYRQGFEHTSFSDIAAVVKISRGNFYHHFKSKDEILDAVIDRRLADTDGMLAEWERVSDDPADRIRSFVHILVTNRADIMRYGCPVGTLCSELSKLDHASRAEANQLFARFRTWLGCQFRLLGRDDDADTLALHVLAWSQGVATLAQAFHDMAFVEREVAQLCAWLTSCTGATSATSATTRQVRA